MLCLCVPPRVCQEELEQLEGLDHREMTETLGTPETPVLGVPQGPGDLLGPPDPPAPQERGGKKAHLELTVLMGLMETMAPLDVTEYRAPPDHL